MRVLSFSIVNGFNSFVLILLKCCCFCSDAHHTEGCFAVVAGSAVTDDGHQQHQDPGDHQHHHSCGHTHTHKLKHQLFHTSQTETAAERTDVELSGLHIDVEEPSGLCSEPKPHSQSYQTEPHQLEDIETPQLSETTAAMPSHWNNTLRRHCALRR